LNNSHLHIACAIRKAMFLKSFLFKQAELLSMPANNQADRESIS